MMRSTPTAASLEVRMSAREPQEMAHIAAETGAKKTHRTWDRMEHQPAGREVLPQR